MTSPPAAAQHQGRVQDLLRHMMRPGGPARGGAAGGISKVMLVEAHAISRSWRSSMGRSHPAPFQELIGLVQQGIDRGEFRPVPRPPCMLISPLLQMMLQEHSFGEQVSGPRALWRPRDA